MSRRQYSDGWVHLEYLGVSKGRIRHPVSSHLKSHLMATMNSDSVRACWWAARITSSTKYLWAAMMMAMLRRYHLSVFSGGNTNFFGTTYTSERCIPAETA
jgi:hypothetical protein